MAATFSYAQAAKGIAPAQSPVKAELTNESSNTEEQTADSTSQANTDIVSSKVETAQEPEVTEAADKEVDHTANRKTSVSGTASPSDGSSSTSTVPKDEEELNTPNGTSESTWDKQSQVSGTEKVTSAEGAKDKTTEKEKSVPAKELKVAPLPTVNIWHQRKEAQEAKAKAIAALKPSANAGTSKTTSAASSISGDHQPEPSKPASKKKGSDVSEGPKERKKADGGKGREDSASIPPVGDASMWPTPQVAKGEEKKKVQDKTEKADKSPVIRPHGKEKWTPVPYVPTAVFNTPLPTARRGGRTARGGRENTRNGTHGSGADKMAQASTGKQAASADRGRNDQNSGRANSLPAQTRRSNSADAGLPDGRKHQAADRGRGSKADNANAGKNVNGAETFPRHHRDAKQFAKGHDAGHKAGEHGSRNPQMSVDAQSAPRSGPTQDRRFENGPKSADFAGFHDRKEKDFPRESRADRGRGSHRGGRGGFSGSQNSHFPNNHVSHHNFTNPKAYGFNERQRSQHGAVNGSQGHRMNIRSPSLPNSAAMYGAYPFPGDINTMYAYQPMHAGPMTAYPYPQYVEPFSLMNMISMQLEYYFSVDNLCKDMFLRKHMDSQGFVGLAFIASFKRIKTLTEDIELLRHVSRHLRTVEYFASEDGLDRLRPKEHWGQWVLPLEQRDQTAQNEGPSLASHTAQPEETFVSQVQVDGVANGQLSNGTAESHGPKTSLSSAAPEFSPSNNLSAQTEVSNVD
ncbi:hypothetical protein BO70DRAFT_41496 [Aspergillus heteromorphus CBS 117.55]|uniref:HTH La-type RNA-binding domain-containing protein n=1 Tax=Aspergillus heteromorphus CBS 117.55 TaxID=1448321 RepID=A0A317W7L4_9EURO|nr:uncharacterized protein BO70DRAFT_41496 [Aspergillus heteromorphus CBS 117.55]PWY81875.1 hypothetical protein BO70DRAFT_41496 [Aspergillus heteromorphus CBS 117.55]